MAQEPGPIIRLHGDRLDFSTVPGFPRNKKSTPMITALLERLVRAFPNPVERDDLFQELFPDEQVLDPQKVADLVYKTRRFLTTPSYQGKNAILHVAAPTGYRLASTTTGSGNVRPARSSFVGEKSAVDDLVRLIAGHRLVTVLGPVGSGKSRIATDACARRPHDVGHMRVVSVKGLRTEAELIEAIDHSLEPGPQAVSPSNLAGLTTALQGQPTLLFLDGFEHLCGRESVLLTLLEACPSLKILVASQRALGIPLRSSVQAQVFEVDALPLPEEGESQSDNPAVRLFCDRAADARSGSRPADRELPAIAEICRELGGLSQAIELAAACHRDMSADRILANLRTDMFDTLDNAASGPDSFRLAVTEAWALVDESTEPLVAWLSVFEESFSYEAAANLWSAASAASRPAPKFNFILHTLLDCHLIKRHKDLLSSHERYEMLGPNRHFGREMLRNAGHEEAARNAHAAYCLDLANELDKLIGGVKTEQAIVLLEADRPNMGSALDWLLSTNQQEMALRFVIALSWFWTIRNDLAEGRRNLTRVLGAPTVGSQAERAFALNRRANMAQFAGDLDDAARDYGSAIQIAEDANDAWNIGMALNGLGRIAASKGDIPTARSLYERALAARESFAGPGRQRSSAIAVTLDNLGDLDLPEDVKAARSRYVASWGMRRSDTDPDVPGLARSYLRFGLLATNRRLYRLASQWYEKAIEQFAAIGLRDWLACSYQWLANLAAECEHMSEAATLCGIAEQITDTLKIVTPPLDERQLMEATDRARAALGSGFARERSRGRNFSQEQALKFARDYVLTRPAPPKREERSAE